MKSLDECLDILIKIGDGARFWGKYIHELAESLSQLNIEEINKIMDVTDPDMRFSLMCQLFGHVRRNLSKMSELEIKVVLNQLYLLIILENCDYDYRESILRAQSFSDQTKEISEIKKEVWGKVSHLASDRVKKYIGAMLV